MNQSLEAANISPMQAEDGVNGERPTPLLRGGWRDYLAIARFDHTTKHVFIIPGIILAYALRPSLLPAATSIIVGFGSAVAIESAYYVINECLDRDFDAFHAQQSARTDVNRSLTSFAVYTEILLHAVIGLLLLSRLGTPFLSTSLPFLFF